MELVKNRKIADIETAREYVRMKHGQEANPQPSQPRNDQGQFVSKEQIAEDASRETRVNMLAAQVSKIKEKGGPDVMALFHKDQDIKNKVINGEMDFYDVAEMMSKKKPPTPSRSPNGAGNITSNAFANMSSKQFERMERNLEKGVRSTMR